jgi:hypothetical protein
MTALVDSELIKLRSLRMPRWLLLTTVALVILLVLVTVPTSASSTGTLTLYDRDLLARTLGVAAGGGWVVMIVLGALAYTMELRYGTITATYVTTPDRRHALVAKAAATAAVGLLFGVVTTALAVAVSAAVITAHHGTLVWSAGAVEVMMATVVTTVVAGILGVAVGALIRNQVVAVVATLVWLLAVEQLFVALLPAIGKWTPGGAAAGFLQLGRQATTHGSLLPTWAGGLVFLGYTAALTGLSTVAVARRDVV